MRTDITVAAEPRATRGKNEANRLRARGLSPAVVYGNGTDPVAISVNPLEIKKILRSPAGRNSIFNLQIEGSASTPVMVIDQQHEPISSDLLHCDLKRIDLAKRLTVKVTVHYKGDPRGVKEQGGQFDIIHRSVEIECLPDDIPQDFTVDVQPLLIGQGVRASELPLSGSMKLISSPDMLLTHIVAVRGSNEAAAAPADGKAAAPAKGATPAKAAAPAPAKKK
jgi:large subunit ribosomal protein L25